MFVLSEIHHILVASKPCSLVKELTFEILSDFFILVLSLDFVKAYHLFSLSTSRRRGGESYHIFASCQLVLFYFFVSRF